ncbi:5-oxoprolinase subunit PxpA [Amantichitinum ursilacus]|uniref:LamB/YcsF family protein n=1 Tax=Amantichitinum ursilacus TaxID=857265 RepID=A0A0N0XL15_9NEIS|nr:5-oxoprolinase subunit PxpA [Amantichitinum ursilacus]KPC53308.1 LamB/YcsF family protein [Amantichitinum ursilacus]
MKIDLNADLGEGYPYDEALMAQISSANIACGGHTGDALSMRHTVRLALRHGVRIGAHPSYPDRAHFGRRSLLISHEALQASLSEQIAVLRAICQDEGATLAYVKPHGMLYNDAARDITIADCVLRAVAEVDASLHIMALAGSDFARHAAHMGWQVIEEGFVDRAYQDDGQLVPRTLPGAVLADDAQALQQALALAAGTVQTQSGNTLTLRVDSLCLHGDNAHALDFARLVRAQLCESSA